MIDQQRRRIALLAGLLLLLSPVGFWSVSWALGSRQPTMVTNPADFRAFYCAARTLARGSDPYLTEPLRTCEHDEAATYGLRMLDGLVLPAPLPPFALALFVPIALLPFQIASPLWLGLSLGLFGLSAILLTKLTRFPLLGSLAALGGAVAYVSVPLGQVVPLVVAALCAAAIALRAKKFALAALLCGLSAIEPHVTLPACCAVFVWEARARASFLWVGAGAIALSLAAVGFRVCREYLVSVLPLHALSQIDDMSSQYSLTTLLSAAGVGSRDALLFGGMSYIVMAFAGIVVAGILAARFRDEAYLVFVPPAFAVLGGTFVHLAQIGVAVPALVLILCRMGRNGIARKVAFAALVGLAIPWASIADAPSLAGLLWPHGSTPRTVALSTIGPGTFAEATEMAFRRGGGYGSSGASLLSQIALRLPTWLSLLALVAIAVSGAFPERKAPAALQL